MDETKVRKLLVASVCRCDLVFTIFVVVFAQMVRRRTAIMMGVPGWGDVTAKDARSGMGLHGCSPMISVPSQDVICFRENQEAPGLVAGTVLAV